MAKRSTASKAKTIATPSEVFDMLRSSGLWVGTVHKGPGEYATALVSSEESSHESVDGAWVATETDGKVSVEPNGGSAADVAIARRVYALLAGAGLGPVLVASRFRP